MKQTVYRDSKTGRFSSKATWKRSKSHGGSRYKRERINRKEKITTEPPSSPIPPEDEWEEWAITFKYPS